MVESVACDAFTVTLRVVVSPRLGRDSAGCGTDGTIERDPTWMLEPGLPVVARYSCIGGFSPSSVAGACADAAKVAFAANGIDFGVVSQATRNRLQGPVQSKHASHDPAGIWL